MDLAQKAYFFIIDIIMDVASGVPLKDLKHDIDVFNYLKTSTNALPILAIGAAVLAIQNFLQILFIAKRLYLTVDDKIGFGKLIG
jgi:hypothetical protein